MAGCSPHPPVSSKEDRAAAVVNGVEITSFEVNTLFELSATPGLSKEVVHERKRNILAGLVRTELIAQEAVKQHLDSSPDFTILLHESRRQVLAGMFLKSIGSVTKPLDREAVLFMVSQNPLIFADRKLLVYEEVIIPVVNVPFLLSLNEKVGKGASLDQLVDEIKSKNMPYSRATQAKSTDQLDPVMITVLTGSKPNVPVITRVQDKFAMIFMLHSSIPIPLTGADAERAARNIASAQNRNMAIEKKTKDLLVRAKITYFSDYAPKPTGKKSVEENNALPSPDTAQAEKNNSYTVILILTISAAYVLVILILTASMHMLHFSNWVPRLWPTPHDIVVQKDEDLWFNEYRAHPFVKVFLLFCAFVSVFKLGHQIFLVWTIIDIWIILVSTATGVLLGIGLSHLYALSPFPRWTQGARWVPVVFFTLSLVFVVLVTQHYLRLLG